MTSLGRRIVYGLRTQGFRYLLRAPGNEFVHPRLAMTQRIRNGLIAMHDRLLAPRTDGAWGGDCLQFVCDLSVAPVTFDFASYLAAAEIERRSRQLDGINVLFILGPHDGVRRELPEYDAVLDPAARLWRLRNIHVPMLALLPSVKSYAVCESRRHAAAIISADPHCLYPGDYRLALPRHPSRRVAYDLARSGAPVWPMLRASEAGRRFALAFFDRETRGRKPVVITLRDYGLSPGRNSSQENWVAFADSLDPTRYVPIFVRDTETGMAAPYGALTRHVVCEAATWNLEIRMALYECAWLNMAIMHGPMELCWFNEKARYLVFLKPGLSHVSSEDILAEAGHPAHAQLPFAGPGQRIVWEADDLAILQREFASLEANLPAAAG